LLLAATACVALVSWHQLNDYRVQAVQLDRADRVGAEPMMAMATARILALRALSDSQLQLVERGTVPDHVEDFDRVIDSLRGGALLDRAAAAGADVTGVTAELERFVGIHEGIRALDEEGNHRDAVELAVTEQVASARRLDASILAIGTAARVAFGIGVATAGARLHHEGLELGLLAAALALVVVGLSIRWREYR